MKISELALSYVNRETDHKKEIGRYWASEIYGILKGYLKPGEYLERKEIKDPSMIITGIANEDILTKMLTEMNIDFKPQEKYEVKIKDIVLVVKPDFVFKDYVWETKHPFSANIDKYKYQLEAEYRATKKDVYLGILKTPFKIVLTKYIPNDKLWEEIVKGLYSFHLKVKKYYGGNK